ncbi:MAG: hypothetical protein QOJ96_3441 [Alphaproteobacteria bacterium]|jgi:hypothetical protein|nr:hypothetical protein [Alphaproteobacteria bacterium]
MVPTDEFPSPWRRFYLRWLLSGSSKATIALVCAGLGAAAIMSLPDNPANSQATAAALPAVQQENQPQENTVSAADSTCENQAWPYVDKRCNEPAANQPTRQVRVVSTDRGTSSTIVTPVPSAEPKRVAESAPAPAVAKLEAPTTPPAATPVASAPAPQATPPVQQEAAAPALPNGVATATLASYSAPASGAPALGPTEASAPAPVAENIATAPENTAAPATPKSKSAKLNEKRAVKQAKAHKIAPAAAPSDVVEEVELATLRDGQAEPAQQPVSSRQPATRGVPREVIEAVKAASGSSSGRRVAVSQRYAQPDDEMVSVNYSGRRPQRLFLVPRETVELSEGW